ncbi:hypothetical protein AMK59_5365, partial [Oryctes borbonicus]
KKCYLTGILKINRKSIPDSRKKPKPSKNKSVAYKRGQTMLLFWKDKRVITLLSISDSAGFVTKILRKFGKGVEQNVEKPKVVINYATSIGDVDRHCKLLFLRKSLKWLKKMFFWDMQVCAINSYTV